MPASIKNILIGIFVIAAIGLIVFMLLFLHPTVGDNAKTLRVRFTDIDKVNVGTRVTFAGRPVGEVVSIEEIPSARTGRISRHGDIYVYELVLKVDSSVDVFNTDEIILRTSGLLGERNVEINPRPLLLGEKLEKVENQVLYAVQTTSVEDTMKQIGQLSQKFGRVLDGMHEVIDNIKDQQIIENIGKTAQNVVDISDSLHEPEKIKKIINNVYTLTERAHLSWTTLDNSLQNIYGLTNRARHSWTTIDQILDSVYQLSLRAHASWGKVDETLDGFKTTSENAVAFSEKANQILDYTLQGKGTLGQFFIGDDIYLRIKSILHKGEVVMNDVNTFGLLFHNDKRWQRLQGKRLRLLEKLSNPNDFAHYFNNEMDQISASISRVTMALNKADCQSQSLIFNPEFTTRFSQLLKRVENMEETLKIYNEQVIDQE